MSLLQIARSTFLGARPGRRALLVAVLALCAPRDAFAVAVSPTALYIDSRTRSGTLTLFNSTAQPEEITIDFAFGYPRSDSAGVVTVPVVPVAPAGEPSAAAWMRAFPRRLVLQPGQRQVVRVMVQAPANLAEGEYWARALIRSRGGQSMVEQRADGMQMQLDIETVVVIAANFRQGAVNTGVEVTSTTARREGANVVATVDYRRTGNAAYLGRTRAELVDAGGRVVSTAVDDIAVYRTMRRRITLPVPPGTTGVLAVRLTISTEREDLPPEGLLRAPPISQVVPVR